MHGFSLVPVFFLPAFGQLFSNYKQRGTSFTVSYRGGKRQPSSKITFERARGKTTIMSLQPKYESILYFVVDYM